MTRAKTHKGDEERVAAGARYRTPQSHPIVLADPDDTSPIQTDEERHAVRAKRPTDRRIGDLERKHDVLAAAVAATQLTHARMDGKLDTLVELAAASAEERERRAAADAVAAEARRLHQIAEDLRAEERRANRRKFLIALVTALGVAGAAIVGAMAQGCL